VIVCICRGASERQIQNAVDAGASSLRDLQRCGIGDECGSCHVSLRAMLAASQPEPACSAHAPELVAVPAMA
jgi:bacterioferritin-associated ferredoxin